MNGEILCVQEGTYKVFVYKSNLKRVLCCIKQYCKTNNLTHIPTHNRNQDKLIILMILQKPNCSLPALQD